MYALLVPKVHRACYLAWISPKFFLVGSAPVNLERQTEAVRTWQDGPWGLLSGFVHLVRGSCRLYAASTIHDTPLQPLNAPRIVARPFSNPFVECGVASHAINQATVKRQRDHAALARLQQKIGELALEVGVSTMPSANP